MEAQQEDDVVTVYEFEAFDPRTRSWKLALRRGTLEAIESVQGIASRSTGLMVDRARLDEDGFLVTSRPILP